MDRIEKRELRKKLSSAEPSPCSPDPACSAYQELGWFRRVQVSSQFFLLLTFSNEIEKTNATVPATFEY
jgi:hypothetical protein